MRGVGLGMLVLSLCGCADMLWCNKGPVEIQRKWAQAFDPYPDNDIGPAIPGARPREFDRPIAEPLRARIWPYGKERARLGTPAPSYGPIAPPSANLAPAYGAPPPYPAPSQPVPTASFSDPWRARGG